MASNEITTILGKGSNFDGKLTFEGAVRIDGVFSGKIETKGTLMIGETAEVTAEIVAANVIIEGMMRGEIVATTSLEIHSSARVYGNLQTPSLVIQKGAIFEGGCRMESRQESGRPELSKPVSKRPEVLSFAESEG
ncbi:MAG: polymer-forming cytoskeletal protein [Nannocystis sp.]|jgi:cytoskeletal protein CcmA (bactofilin family)|nr:polymer-forming cytoskeletal protein [Nannocystis sp.]